VAGAYPPRTSRFALQHRAALTRRSHCAGTLAPLVPGRLLLFLTSGHQATSRMRAEHWALNRIWPPLTLESEGKIFQTFARGNEAQVRGAPSQSRDTTFALHLDSDGVVAQHISARRGGGRGASAARSKPSKSSQRPFLLAAALAISSLMQRKPRRWPAVRSTT